MATSRTAPRKVARVRTSIAVAHPVTDWRRDAVVVRLTTAVHSLLSAAARRSADDVVKIGGHLEQIHARLPRGQWLAWLDDNAPFSRSTATNYMELAAWSRRVPAQFDRLRHLGPGKLYVLASAQPQRVVALRPGRLVAIPGSPRRRSIESMSVAELASVVGSLLPGPPAPKVPIEKIVKGVRWKVAALGAAAEVMESRKDEVDEDAVRQIRDELLEVLARIEATLS